jgi:hypothetical protein
MIRLNTLFPATNSTLTFKVNKDKGLLTFFGVLKRYDSSGSGTVATYTPAELRAGISVALGPAQGYDMLVIPQPTSKGGSLDMSINAGGQTDHATSAVSSQESIGWTLILT